MFSPITFCFQNSWNHSLAYFCTVSHNLLHQNQGKSYKHSPTILEHLLALEWLGLNVLREGPKNVPLDSNMGIELAIGGAEMAVKRAISEHFMPYVWDHYHVEKPP